jgi:hypothetical protein
LQANSPCAAVVPLAASRSCLECVEAFIDITGFTTLKPVFYRCYWSTPTSTAYETISFEWSATEEYIKWYEGAVINSGGGFDVYTLITNAGVPIPAGKYVPLLKVTNHSPSSYI